MKINFDTLAVGDILRKPTYAVSTYKVVEVHPAQQGGGWGHGRRSATLEGYKDDGTLSSHMGKYYLHVVWEGEAGPFVQEVAK